MFLQKIFFKNSIVNLLIMLIPVTFIAGNFLLNLNILILVLYVFLLHRLDIFKIKITTIDKLILIFFSYIFLNGILNNFFNFDFVKAPSNLILIKSLSYFRFLILYFVLRFLIERNMINYKFIFLSFSTLSLFVSFDIIIQYVFEKDLFGYGVSGLKRRLAGPFGDEYIAGSFIQRFFIFVPFSILFFLKIEKNWLFNIILFLAYAFCAVGILLAGNRIPFVLFLATLFLIQIFEKSLRKNLIIFFLISSFILTIVFNFNDNIRFHYAGFITKGVEVTSYLKNRLNVFSYQEIDSIPNTYIKEIETGILTWQQNKVFGGGIKSFYYSCTKIESLAMNKYGGTSCNTHPHNYYLQIASELGLIGLLLVSLIFLAILVTAIKAVFYSKDLFVKHSLFLPFFIVFLTEIFPFKTTGSFFTSGNATFLFFVIAFIVGLESLNKKKNDKR